MILEDTRAIENPQQMTNNVVILGAGASVATLNDLGLPAPSVMDNFIINAGLEHILSGIHLYTSSNNLEDIYSELYDRPEYEAKRIKLEQGIYQYMFLLRCPHVNLKAFS